MLAQGHQSHLWDKANITPWEELPGGCASLGDPLALPPQDSAAIH